jgi:Ca-activated chloride channel family protein
MSFLWPWLLLLLLLVPLLIAAYIWVLRRKKRFAVRYSSLSLIREALPKRSRWRQHVPFALFTLALVCLATAVARPVAAVTVPLSRTTIILAIDVSRSMCATDVDPNRLTVAQEAALAFVEDHADEVRIGIVAFASFAEIVVPPTNDKAALKEAIENLTTSIGTAIGSATLKSIDAIAALNEAVAPSGAHLGSETGETPMEGFYQPDIIVVLTDGANTRGPLPLDAAEKASGRQVRVYTIGFGSTEPGRMVCTPAQLGSDVFGGGFGGGGGGFDGGGFGGGGFGGGGFRRYLMLDEPTLQAVADLTGGDYYRAEDAEQLYEVFVSLPTEFVLQRERLEMSALFSMLGVVFATAAAVLAMVWNRFP